MEDGERLEIIRGSDDDAGMILLLLEFRFAVECKRVKQKSYLGFRPHPFICAPFNKVAIN